MQWKRLAPALLIVVASGFLPSPDGRAGARANANPLLAYKDRIEIEELMHKYSYFIDSRLGEAFASTFTPDGELAFPGTRVQGREQLIAFGSRPLTDTIHTHFVGGIVLVQTAPGQVHARSMVILSRRDLHNAAPPTLEGVGYYDDRIVKTRSGWRFLSRRADASIPVSADFLPSLPTK